jgi:hypothetical protein
VLRAQLLHRRHQLLRRRQQRHVLHQHAAVPQVRQLHHARLLRHVLREAARQRQQVGVCGGGVVDKVESDQLKVVVHCHGAA